MDGWRVQHIVREGGREEWRAYGPLRADEEEAIRDAEYASMRGALDVHPSNLPTVIDVLETERTTEQERAELAERERDEMRARVAELESEVMRLREALRPFADAARAHGVRRATRDDLWVSLGVAGSAWVRAADLMGKDNKARTETPALDVDIAVRRLGDTLDVWAPNLTSVARDNIVDSMRRHLQAVVPTECEATTVARIVDWLREWGRGASWGYSRPTRETEIVARITAGIKAGEWREER